MNGISVGLGLSMLVGLTGCSVGGTPSSQSGSVASTTDTGRGALVDTTPAAKPAAGSPADAGTDSGGAVACQTPGRFAQVDPDTVKDTSTGLTWERTMRAPAAWNDAAQACARKGMRLPTFNEWYAVMTVQQVNSAFTPGGGGTPTCSLPAGMYVAPFDTGAMPTSVTDLGGVGGFASLWTKEPDPNGEGAYVTVDLQWGDGDPWDVSEGYQPPMGGADDAGNVYRCVQ